MDQHKKIVTTQIIEDVVNRSVSDKIELGDIVYSLESSGFGLSMIIFAIAIIIPTPPPVPSIFAIPLLFFSFQMVAGYSAPKLPKFISKIKIKRSVLEILVRKSSPYLDKIERVLRPRWQFMIFPIAERIIGAMILIFAICISIPIPFSNFIPGLGILVTSFGLIGKDGVFVVLGLVIGIIGSIVSMMAILFGLEAVTYIKNLLF